MANTALSGDQRDFVGHTDSKRETNRRAIKRLSKFCLLCNLKEFVSNSSHLGPGLCGYGSELWA